MQWREATRKALLAIPLTLFIAPSLAADFADDFDSGTLDNTRFQLNVGEGELSNGKVLLSANSTDGNWINGSLQLREYSDYVEGELSLASGVSLPAARSRVGARIEILGYNTEADGGVDGALGDVQIELVLLREGTGRSIVRYCLSRSLDAGINELEAVMDGDNCRDFPIRVELDRAYRAAISIDRAASSISFRVDGYTQTVAISSAMFLASRPYSGIDVFADKLGSAQASIDNVRTAPSALTDSERTAGLSVPPAFPAAPSAASMVADSTIDNVYDQRAEVSFWDDFNSPDSTAFGYNTYAEAETTPDNAVAFIDDSVQLAVHSPDGDYSHAALVINDSQSDSISAQLSLSSSSALPVEGDARAEISINTVLLNDTYENAESRAGDLRFSLGFRYQGDGGLRLSYWANRQSEDDTSVDLRAYELPQFEALENIQLAFDTVYEVSIQLNRERRVVIFSFAGVNAEYPLSNLYAPYRSEHRVRVRHEGSSGRAVGRVHAITTAELDFDFEQTVPAIAPLEPQWDGRYADSSVEWADERITLRVDKSKQGRGRSRLSTIHRNDYFAADLALSASSEVAEGEVNRISLAATMFNDMAVNNSESEDRAGDSHVQVNLHDSSDEGLYAVYCYWYFDGEDWTERLGNDPQNCDNRFALPIEYEESYTATIALDRTESQLVLALADETHNVPLTAIHATRNYYRVEVNARGDGLVVGHVDNLRFGDNAPALPESPDRLLIKPAQPTQPAPDDGTEIAPDAAGSGGGSVHPLACLLIAGFTCWRRRSQAARRTRDVAWCAAIAVTLSGCAASPQLLPAQNAPGPMDMPVTGEATRAHKNNLKKGDNFYTENQRLADGSVKNLNSDGCSWLERDIFEPSLSWSNCPHPKARWRSGSLSEGLDRTGEAWPLIVGKSFSYRYSYKDANGKSGGASTRRCKVEAPVHLAMALGEIDAHHVSCRDSGAGDWWIKRSYFLSAEHGLVKYRRVHSSRGLEIDWEMISRETI